MEEPYLPVLSHFQNGNGWIASEGRLRFRVTPGEDVLTAELWEGPWSREFSAVEEEKTFPLTDEGIQALAAWLPGRAEEVNARPARSLAENLARRVVQAGQ